MLYEMITKSATQHNVKLTNAERGKHEKHLSAEMRDNAVRDGIQVHALNYKEIVENSLGKLLRSNASFKTYNDDLDEVLSFIYSQGCNDLKELLHNAPASEFDAMSKQITTYTQLALWTARTLAWFVYFMEGENARLLKSHEELQRIRDCYDELMVRFNASTPCSNDCVEPDEPDAV